MAYDIKPLTNEEKSKMIATNELSTTIRALSTLEEYKEFKVGDTLVAGYLKQNGSQELITTNGIVDKFRVVHIDDFGLVYVKKMLLSSSKLSQSITCINVSSLRFVIDPSLAEAIILDAENEYDPAVELRNRRLLLNKVRKLNKDRILIPKDKTEDEKLEIIKSLKVGDKVYYSYDSTPTKDSNITEYEVVEAYRSYEVTVGFWTTSKQKRSSVKLKDLKNNREHEEWNFYRFYKEKPATTSNVN